MARGQGQCISLFAVTCSHLQPLDWPQVAAGASDRPNLPSDRKWPQRASGRKWPQVAAEGKWPQVTASGRRGQVAASDRKWPLRSNGRKWPQVAAFGKWPRVAASGRLFQFQIPHLMQPLWNFYPCLGNDPIWQAYFSDGLKPPTRKSWIRDTSWKCKLAINLMVLNRKDPHLSRDLFHQQLQGTILFFLMVGLTYRVNINIYIYPGSQKTFK